MRNRTSQKMVYTVLIGNSAAVNRIGNSDTWPATASGRNAPKYRRSCSAIRLNGTMTRRIAFSWTCHPKRNEAYPQRVTAPTNPSQVGLFRRRKSTAYVLSVGGIRIWSNAYHLSAQSKDEASQWDDVRKHGKGSVSDETTRYAIHCLSMDM